MTVAERSMAIALRGLNRIAGSDVMDRLGVRAPAERVVYRATRDGFRAAGSAARTFQATQKLKGPARLKATRKGRELFDLSLTDEQEMLVEAFRDFGSARLRPAAAAAEKGDVPAELFAEADELGLTMLGVPEELGGAVSERSSVTAVLAAEALSHGDAGLAVAILASGGVAGALALWGDADQQAKYLPPFTSESVPVAAVALAEPRPLFDPLQPETTARATADGYVLSGVKSGVPRAADAELLVVSARLEGRGPALFLVEAKSEGVLAKADPAMGLRGAQLGQVRLEDVAVPKGALLGEADPKVMAEAVARSRIAWGAVGIGVAQAVLDYVIPYVNDRSAFGEPISHRQAVAFTVSDIAIELEGLRLVTLRAASRADAGKSFAREAALARQLADVRATRIGSDGVQLLGGHGYITEHPVERWYRDLRAVGLLDGALLV